MSVTLIIGDTFYYKMIPEIQLTLIYLYTSSSQNIMKNVISCQNMNTRMYACITDKTVKILVIIWDGVVCVSV